MGEYCPKDSSKSIYEFDMYDIDLKIKIYHPKNAFKKPSEIIQIPLGKQSEYQWLSPTQSKTQLSFDI